MGMYTLVDSAKEEANSQREDFDISSGDASMSVTLRVPAADRHAVVLDALVNGYVWPHTASMAPDSRATRASVVPAPNSRVISTAQNGLVYEDYLVTLYFSNSASRSGQQTDNNGNIYSEELRPHAEALRLDHKDFMWSNKDPVKEGESPIRIVRSFDLVRTIYDLRPPLPSLLLDGPGCVNASSYLSPTLGLNFPAETLLFGDPSMSRSLTQQGFTGIILTLTFSYRKDGWNKFWRAKTQSYESIQKLDGLEYKNHPPIDFSQILF